MLEICKKNFKNEQCFVCRKIESIAQPHIFQTETLTLPLKENIKWFHITYAEKLGGNNVYLLLPSVWFDKQANTCLAHEHPRITQFRSQFYTTLFI